MRTLDKYILDADGHPVLEPDLLKWAEWLETADRTVALDRFIGDAGAADVRVSTVFLGLDHSFPLSPGPSYAPILFETMVFGGEHDGYQERYGTRDEALEGHRAVVDMVRAALADGER